MGSTPAILFYPLQMRTDAAHLDKGRGDAEKIPEPNAQLDPLLMCVSTKGVLCYYGWDKRLCQGRRSDWEIEKEPGKSKGKGFKSRKGVLVESPIKKGAKAMTHNAGLESSMYS